LSLEISLKMLKNIRELDSIIDFSRATLQLHVVLVLSHYRYGLTADEIAFKTGFRRKTVLDTLRKLEIKGLVVRRNDLFFLSDIGVKYLEQLKSLLKIREAGKKDDEKDLREIAYKLVFYGTLKNIIVLLGKSNGLTLVKISHTLGVSPKKVKNYITHLNNMSKNKLVKTTRRRSIFGVKRVYVLTAYGKRLYNNIISIEARKASKRQIADKIILYSSVLGILFAVLLLPISHIISISILLAAAVLTVIGAHVVHK